MTGLMALNRHSFCFKCMKIAAGLNLLFHESLKESSSIPVNSDSTKTNSHDNWNFQLDIKFQFNYKIYKKFIWCENEKWKIIKNT